MLNKKFSKGVQLLFIIELWEVPNSFICIITAANKIHLYVNLIQPQQSANVALNNSESVNENFKNMKILLQIRSYRRKYQNSALIKGRMP